MEGFGVSFSVRHNLLKVHAINVLITAGFLFILSLLGFASVAPVELLGSGLLAKIAGFLLSGSVLYGLIMLVLHLAERLGCIFSLMVWFVLPLASLAVTYLEIGFLFSFSIALFWQVILGFVLVVAIVASIQQFLKIRVVFDFSEEPDGSSAI